MSVLVPMRSERFAQFAAEANEAYAHDNVLAGRWAPEDARANAEAEFRHLLPDGIDTPDHFFYEVTDSSSNRVGFVWFAVMGSGASRAGYLFNIQIHADQRRKGHGRAALLALESMAADMRLPSIRLNVFGHNPGAQALYRSLGYVLASSSMRKVLPAAPDQPHP